uniref:Protein kinase domain-containing protein n=1 Tax=Oryza rufipogon TaxID=4529 RepID=A0A0E0QQ98_ORYRU
MALLLLFAATIIDCGLDGNTSSYQDSHGIFYEPDGAYVDAGENHRLSADYESIIHRRADQTVRSFPTGERNCYALPTVLGAKYLVRMTFFYGNYDGKETWSWPTLHFDLYLGVDRWTTVHADSTKTYEALFVAWASWTPVCLVNTGSGTPFVNAVELRMLGSDLYPDLTANESMNFVERVNMGSNNSLIQYHDDLYDRYWWPMSRSYPMWKNISTVSTISNYIIPLPVIQTAIEAVSKNTTLEYNWRDNEGSHYYKTYMYFADFQNSQLRQFNISFNTLTNDQYSPLMFLSPSVVVNKHEWYKSDDGTYTITLKATAESILPPMINALEVYTRISHTNPKTLPTDFDTIMAIKFEYGIKKDWTGDPCFPVEPGWDGVKCSNAIDNTMRIISLFDSNEDMCHPHQRIKKAKRAVTIAISVVIPVMAIGALVLAYFIWRQKKNPKVSSTYPPREPNLEITPTSRNDIGDALQKVENRRFTYKELEKLTNKFEKLIGQGGFGLVYYGRLEDGTEVAIKMRSESSSHGLDQFFAEVQSLTKVHHRNLVSLVGYCREKDHLSLVYEYMARGSLYDHLRGNKDVHETLNWRTRLRVAVEAAQGLDYLHKGCSLPIIHRDVKTQNILLGQNLQAKIADFGLCKTYLSETQTHISITPAGSVGYMDPEYYHTGRLTENSDIYSFGVVLLEIVTGEFPILAGQDHIIQRVKKNIATGNISLVADVRLGGAYDVSSMWKVVDTALSCTADIGAQRLTMAAVVVQLKESLELEEAHVDSGLRGSASTVSDTTFSPSAR